MSELRFDELADEYRELLDRRDDEDQFDSLDEDDLARLSVLSELDSDVGDRLEELGRYGCVGFSDLTDEARRLVDDVYDVDLNRWPFYLIDWQRAGEELASDYEVVSFEGTDYYFRD